MSPSKKETMIKNRRAAREKRRDDWDSQTRTKRLYLVFWWIALIVGLVYLGLDQTLESPGPIILIALTGITVLSHLSGFASAYEHLFAGAVMFASNSYAL